MFALLKYFNDAQAMTKLSFNCCLMYKDVALTIYHKFCLISNPTAHFKLVF